MGIWAGRLTMVGSAWRVSEGRGAQARSIGRACRLRCVSRSLHCDYWGASARAALAGRAVSRWSVLGRVAAFAAAAKLLSVCGSSSMAVWIPR